MLEIHTSPEIERALAKAHKLRAEQMRAAFPEFAAAIATALRNLRSNITGARHA